MMSSAEILQACVIVIPGVLGLGRVLYIVGRTASAVDDVQRTLYAIHGRLVRLETLAGVKQQVENHAE